MKKCSSSQCSLRNPQPESAFYRNAARSDGLNGECIVCTKLRYRKDAMRPEIRARKRGARLRLRYGLTSQEYDSILAQQGGVCAICGQSAGHKKGFTVDHDHATGKVRGVLCHPCNIAIGFLERGRILLPARIDYLRRHGAGLE